MRVRYVLVANYNVKYFPGMRQLMEMIFISTVRISRINILKCQCNKYATTIKVK